MLPKDGPIREPLEAFAELVAEKVASVTFKGSVSLFLLLFDGKFWHKLPANFRYYLTWSDRATKRADTARARLAP